MCVTLQYPIVSKLIAASMTQVSLHLLALLPFHKPLCHSHWQSIDLMPFKLVCG